MTPSLAIANNKSSLWLKSRNWDLTWISLSSLLMIVPYSSYFIGRALGLDADGSRNAVNVLVAFCIGGPHMYATYTRTAFEPSFRKLHTSVIPAAVIIPALVIYLGVYHFIFLLSFFFFWASVHVLHQIIFIVDCYNGKQRTITKYSKMVDYAVVLTALYPMAMYRFVHNTFHVGQAYLYFPEFLKVDATWWFASAAFALSLSLYIMKTIREFRNGDGNIPKTILMAVTVLATFFTPFFNELDVAFQGLNTWHSFQYLGLTWYINRLRLARGEISSPAMRKISSPGSWWKYYGFNVLMNCTTLILWGALLLTRSYNGLTFDQSYYIVILCFLLTHYYHDHILFRNPNEVRSPEQVIGLAQAS